MANKTVHSSVHDADPKAHVIELVGSLEGYRLSGYQVLVAKYVRPDVAMRGPNGTPLLRHGNQQKEDEWQGKVGLIIAMGPLAYQEYGEAWPDGRHPKVGDWVGFRQMEGVARSINGHMCKIFEDKQIREILPHPDFIA